MRTVWFENGVVCLLDQTRLPHETVIVRCHTTETLAEAVRALRIRGAPAIGVAAAYGIAQIAAQVATRLAGPGLAAIEASANQLAATRPTAINLRWAVERMLTVARAARDPVDRAARLAAEAQAIAAEDAAANLAIGRLGAEQVRPGDRILTYCNTGGLATSGYGTAFGILRAAHEAAKDIRVIACETRPVLQGARLTAWELTTLGIPFTLITDNAAGALMARGEIDRVIVGADRIAANGDVANKIGTYSLAVLAAAHGIPFIVAAPTSTVDLQTPSGAAIPIEERPAVEVTHIAGRQIAPDGAPVRNPAFDITPARLITAIVTEAGVAHPPYESRLAEMVAAGVKR